jgi:hypothetical protein
MEARERERERGEFKQPKPNYQTIMCFVSLLFIVPLPQCVSASARRVVSEQSARVTDHVTNERQMTRRRWKVLHERQFRAVQTTYRFERFLCDDLPVPKKQTIVTKTQTQNCVRKRTHEEEGVRFVAWYTCCARRRSASVDGAMPSSRSSAAAAYR